MQLSPIQSRRGNARRRGPGGRMLAVALALVWGLLGTLQPVRAADEFPEYQLKAAFLYNFAKFVTWPESSFTNAEAPITIGIVGTDPFGPLLEDIIKGKTANGRKLAIRHLSPQEKPTGCHILFIGR